MRLQRFSANQGSQLLDTVAEKLREVGPESCALLFDFDGVLAAKQEDRIYRLAVAPDEPERLKNLSTLWSMDLTGYDVPYQRHLLYQAAAAELQIPIEEGPGCPVATYAATLGAKIFVLTARSGFYAIARMQAFLREKGLEPIESFHIGRVPKDRQVILLLNSLANHHVLFFDDVAGHVDQIAEAIGASEGNSRLEMFLIEHGEVGFDSDALRTFAWSVLDRAAQLRTERQRPMTSSRLEQLQIGLEHGREMFVYHAGQRTTSIRFFFTALAIFAAAWVGVLTTNSPITSKYRGACGLILGVGAMIITFCFWRLDKRNAQLVDSNEALIKAVERELAVLTGIPQFETIVYTDTAQPERLTRYRTILRILFVVFLLLSLLGSLFSILLLFGLVGV
jgi:hypothetical protein